MRLLSLIAWWRSPDGYITPFRGECGIYALKESEYFGVAVKSSYIFFRFASATPLALRGGRFNNF